MIKFSMNCGGLYNGADSFINNLDGAESVKDISDIKKKVSDYHFEHSFESEGEEFEVGMSTNPYGLVFIGVKLENAILLSSESCHSVLTSTYHRFLKESGRIFSPYGKVSSLLTCAFLTPLYSSTILGERDINNHKVALEEFYKCLLSLPFFKPFVKNSIQDVIDSGFIELLMPEELSEKDFCLFKTFLLSTRIPMDIPGYFNLTLLTRFLKEKPELFFLYTSVIRGIWDNYCVKSDKVVINGEAFACNWHKIMPEIMDDVFIKRALKGKFNGNCSTSTYDLYGGCYEAIDYSLIEDETILEKFFDFLVSKNFENFKFSREKIFGLEEIPKNVLIEIRDYPNLKTQEHMSAIILDKTDENLDFLFNCICDFFNSRG